MKRDNIKKEMNVRGMNTVHKATGCSLAHGPRGHFNRVVSQTLLSVRETINS